MEEKMTWFNNSRFGMFVHFGMYTLYQRDAWVLFNEAISKDEYDKMSKEFNPKKFDAKKLVDLAKKGGMKYVVFGAKHHDGFCLFNSNYTKFNSYQTCGRDLVKEFTDACRDAGLGVGLYFSVKDWSFPCYFTNPKTNKLEWQKLVNHFHNQTLELMKNYGKIDILFYDCADDANLSGWGDMKASEIFDSENLKKQVLELQPNIIINDRSGAKGDYETPEQRIPDAIYNKETFYESCMTLNHSWGYTKGDMEFATPKQVIHNLAACSARGVNLLLNIGPKPDGSIDKNCYKSIIPVGKWLQKYGEGFYGSDLQLDNYWDFFSQGRITTNKNVAYFIIEFWDGKGYIRTSYLDNQVLKAELLGCDNELQITKNVRQIRIDNLPKRPPNKYANVLKLTLSAPPKANKFY